MGGLGGSFETIVAAIDSDTTRFIGIARNGI